MISNKKTRLAIGLLILFGAIAVFTYKQYTHNEYEIRDLEEIKEQKVLRVVTNYNPIDYYASTDTIAGFNHDLLQALERHTGLKLEITIENDLTKSIEELEKGRYDLIARNIPVNNSLKDDINFTEPLIRNKLVLVQRKPAENDSLAKELIRSQLNLAKKIVYVSKSSPAILRLKNLSIEIGDTIYVKEDSLYNSYQLAMKVASGEIDYAICNNTIGQTLSEKIPNIDTQTDIGFSHHEAWAIRNHSQDLLDYINNWIITFQKTKEYQLDRKSVV